MFTICTQQQLLKSQQYSTQQTAVPHILNTTASNTAELRLSGRRLSGSPIIRNGLVLPVNISCNCATSFHRLNFTKNRQINIRNYVLMFYWYANKYVAWNSRL